MGEGHYSDCASLAEPRPAEDWPTNQQPRREGDAIVTEPFHPVQSPGEASNPPVGDKTSEVQVSGSYQLKILDHDPLTYLYKQFPATVGHIPLIEFTKAVREQSASILFNEVYLGQVEKRAMNLSEDRRNQSAVISSKDAEIERLRAENDRLKDSLVGGLGEAAKYWMNRANELELSGENPANCQTVKVEKRFIPEGWELIEAYKSHAGYILIDDPNDIEDENHPEYHNCDAMGCSTFSHVALRISFGEVEQLRERVKALEEGMKAKVEYYRGRGAESVAASIESLLRPAKEATN